MRVFAYLWIKQGGHAERFFMPLCEGGMSLNGSTSSTQTPVNIKSSVCCNKSKRAARRILVERSTGKHRSLPSSTGRFVLMICSRVCSLFFLPEGVVHVFICSNLLVHHIERAEQKHFHNKIYLSTSSSIQISCVPFVIIANLNVFFFFSAIVQEVIIENICLWITYCTISYNQSLF